MKRILFSLLFASIFHFSYAVKAYPGLISAIQPDGSTISYFLHGDENFSYMVSENGYLLTYDEKGFLVYGALDVVTEKIQPSPARPTKFVDVESELKAISEVRVLRGQSAVMRAASNKGYPLTGSPKSLVILVNFSDCSFKSKTAKSDFVNLLNQNDYAENGATGSARDYFRNASNGKFDPEFVVVGPYNLANDLKYYGEEEGSVHDKRPGNLIVDACAAADVDIDFADFDVNGDGYVDNIFVYYAGHNQAEGGGASTIWPHRSYIVSKVEFDGVRLGDYACTSEFRGNKGHEMCGIGTFVHEFGHVLGLPDLYSTNYAGHKTLGSWDVMDNGSYNSYGRTPPTYSAYERFYLDWLTPIQLDNNRKCELQPISISNTAYLVAASAHNMQGDNPNPKEFFLLENRQKQNNDGVPAQGLLITRITYNKLTWDNNTLNNNAKTMGVEICCAERSTDVPTYNVFPGKGKVTDFQFKLRDGSVLEKSLSQITEKDRLLSFVFGNPSFMPNVQIDGDLQSFSASIGEEQVKRFTINATSVVGTLNLNLNSENYSLRLADSNEPFTSNIGLNASSDSIISAEIEVKYAPKVYTYKNYVSETLLLTTEFFEKQLVLRGVAPRPAYVVAPIAREAENITPYTFTAVWDSVFDATEYHLSVYYLDGLDTIFVVQNQVVESSKTAQISCNVINLKEAQEYKYAVRASDKDPYGRYENITNYSNEITVTTLSGFGAESRKLDILKQGDTYVVYLPAFDENHSIFIYSIDGKLITSVPVNSNIVDIPRLQSKRVYILKYASNEKLKAKTKVIKLYYE